jgi:hypothetical protein
MAIVYTTSWETSRSDSLDSREFGTIATVVATAGETLNAVNVKTAVHATTGDPLPVLNSVSPLDSRYYVRSISLPRLEGPRYATLAITYGIGRGSGPEEEEDPLAVPLRYRVRNGVSSEATDADVNGNALLNSAGDPFGSTVQTNASAIFIDVIRNETDYNLPQSIAFTNKTNEDTFSLAGYPINPGEAYCTGIQPEGDYSLGDDFKTIVYSFELRERLTLGNGDRVTSFIHRLLDQGKRGWGYGLGNGAALEDIYSKNGDGTERTPVSADVLLNDGIPLDRSSHVTNNENFDDAAGRGWEPQAAPGKAPNAVRDVNQDTLATFLLYQKHLTANFAELGLA